MDAVGDVAGWLSFAVTALGLGSLITQANAIEERLDPFRDSRDVEYLGAWVARQPKRSRFKLGRPSPVGPVISASLVDGFCGSQLVGVSRLPLRRVAKASWTVLLAVLHERPVTALPGSEILRTNTFRSSHGAIFNDLTIELGQDSGIDPDKGNIRTSTPSADWTTLRSHELVRAASCSCISISRASFIALLSVSNSAQTFRHSDASGHRAAYAGYFGVWYINWPIGQAAVVSLAPHESHSLATDVFPPMFARRVDRCIRMTTGVITSPDAVSFQCAFPGRKPPGKYVLQYQRKGFVGADGGRHLYHLTGGKAHEVDFLYPKRLEADLPSNTLQLSLPSRELGIQNILFVPQEAQMVLEHALDCLPWSSLAWTIHRGLRDILLAYTRNTMNKFRVTLALQLQASVDSNKRRLEGLGWAPGFIVDSMADIAFNSMMAGEGASGDSVRVVTDVAILLCPSTSTPHLDETNFWRHERHEVSDLKDLSQNAIIALTKVFLLEWSYEFDYKMYRDLPPQLLMK